MSSPFPRATLPARSTPRARWMPSQSQDCAASPRQPSPSRFPRRPQSAHGGGAGGRPTVLIAHAGCRLAGVGSSVPETVLTNLDLEKIVDTNDEWISRRTGIRQRRVLGEGELLSDHGAAASRNALEMAGLDAQDLDMVLLATSSPDDIFGSACQVQSLIGATNAVAFDVTCACSGFVVGLVTGAQYIRTGTCKHILVIGADALSRVIDWRDRTTCILFGDACGAVVLSPSTDDKCSLLGISMASDGGGQDRLHAKFQTDNGAKPQADDGRASLPASYSNIHMNGQEVFKWAVRGVPKIIEDAMSKSGLHNSDLDWLVMHQANQRILSAAADRLGLPNERVISNLQKYGNTSAASIPLALDEAVRDNIIKPGDVIAMAGFGAGLTMAAAIVRWG